MKDSKVEIRIDSNLSEVLGVLLGDGCVSRFEYRGRSITEVAFTGNPSELWYYRDFLRPTIRGKFSVGGYLCLREDATVRLHIRGVKLARFLSEINIPVGKRRDAVIPAVLYSHARLLKAFVRGLYHAEGSMYRRYSKRYASHARVYDKLLVIQFRMRLRSLMFQVNRTLRKLGINPTRVTEPDGVYTFRITSQKEIARFIHVIRPRYKLRPSPRQRIL